MKISHHQNVIHTLFIQPSINLFKNSLTSFLYIFHRTFTSYRPAKRFWFESLGVATGSSLRETESSRTHGLSRRPPQRRHGPLSAINATQSTPFRTSGSTSFFTRIRALHRRHDLAKSHRAPTHYELTHSGDICRIRTGRFPRTRSTVHVDQHRIVFRFERAGSGIRLQRDQKRPDIEDVRQEFLLLPSERDFFDAEERIYGLGETRSESFECKGRYLGSSQ